MSDLEARIARIARDDTLLQSVEAVTSQTAVLPVLDALGWDCWNAQEVTPQFALRGGQVDYCLRDADSNRNLALIEVKRTGTELAGHQEQLLRYGFDEGVPLAALTDGRIWWLYLATENVRWEQRRFFSIEFSRDEQVAARAATDLERFLSRQAVVGGGALEAAKSEFANRERERLVTAALPTAWKQVLSDPDGLLIDLVADAVREEAGHRPSREAVHQFLLGNLRQEPSRTPVLEPHRQRRAQRTFLLPNEQLVEAGQQLPPTADFKDTRPVAFWLDGVRHRVDLWREVLTEVCDELDRTNTNFTEIALRLKGRSRHYFSRSRHDFKEEPAQLANGLFTDITLNANSTVRRTVSVLEAVRGRGGTDSFRIEIR